MSRELLNLQCIIVTLRNKTSARHANDFQVDERILFRYGVYTVQRERVDDVTITILVADLPISR